MEKLLELKEKFEKLQKELMTSGKQAFQEAVKDLFIQIPSLKTIKWAQYTPYFNDGDTCEFSVNEPVFSNLNPEDINSWGDYEGKEGQPENSWIDYSWKIEKNKFLKENEKKLLKQFSEFTQSNTGQDLLLSIFDNHVEVTCTKDRIEVEEFQHE